MFSGRNLILIMLAAFVAIAAGLLAQRWISQQIGLQNKNKVDTASVVAVALNIPYGTIIEAQQLKIVKMPKELLPEHTLDSMDKVIGNIAKREMVTGELILENHISKSNDSSILSSLLSPHMRAITVRVDDVIGVGGFLLPGSFVDVLATRKTGDMNSRAITETVLQKIKVLAVDQKAAGDEKSPKVVRSVTLEVALEQAERLISADAEGSIQLTLRNPLDDSTREASKPESPVNNSKPMYRSSYVTVIKGVEEEKKQVR